MQPEDLPPLDLVVLSHHHGDHFDDRAAEGLDKDLLIITTPHATKKLHRQGFSRTVGLDTWQVQRVTRGSHWLQVTSLPAKHAPQPLRTLLPPVMGSMVEIGRGQEVMLRTYLSGDTLLHDRLAEIPARYPDIHLGVLHLGGTRILGVKVTMDADDGVEAVRRLRPHHAVPVHNDDYGVFRSPLRAFREEYDRSGLPTEMHYMEIGQTWAFEPRALRDGPTPERTPGG